MRGAQRGRMCALPAHLSGAEVARRPGRASAEATIGEGGLEVQTTGIVPFNWQTIAAAFRTFQGPCVVMDCGACDGMDTARLWRIAPPPARVIAFEPDPRNVALFRSAGHPSEIRLVEAAVGSEDGSTILWQSARTGGRPWTPSSSIREPVDGALGDLIFPTAVRVPLVTLDSFCAAEGIGAIDFLWADLQGAERDLVAGGRRTLQRTKWLYLEAMDHEGYKGQWTRREMAAALTDEWGIAREFPEDILFYRREMFSAPPELP